MSPALKAIAAGFIGKIGLDRTGIVKMLGTVLRGDAPPSVTKGLAFAREVLGNDMMLNAILQIAKEQGHDVPSLVENYTGIAEGLTGIQLEGDWKARCETLLDHLLGKQENCGLRAIVICPNCNYAHGV